jgi:glycosyltransferase involved in cell wall biosynthesis
VLEALAMNLPVVASNTGGTSSIINDDIGLLFEPGNHRSLATSILYLWKNPRKLQLMKEKARLHIINNYTWEKSVMQHALIFNNLSMRNNVS